MSKVTWRHQINKPVVQCILWEISEFQLAYKIQNVIGWWYLLQWEIFAC